MNDSKLAEYLAKYIEEEYMRQTDSDHFWDYLPDMIVNGIEAFRGGAEK